MDDGFRVDPTKVVEEREGVWVPDMQARYEYTRHFGKFDFKDLCRRYRWSGVGQPPPPLLEKTAQPSVVMMRTAIRKRRLVQSTLASWKRPQTTAAAKCPA